MAPLITKGASDVKLSTSVDLVPPKQQLKGNGKAVVVSKGILAAATTTPTVSPAGLGLGGGGGPVSLPDEDSDDEADDEPIGSMQTIVRPPKPAAVVKNPEAAVVKNPEEESSPPPMLPLGLRTDAPATTSAADTATTWNGQLPAYATTTAHATTSFGTVNPPQPIQGFGDPTQPIQGFDLGSPNVLNTDMPRYQKQGSPNPNGDKGKEKKHRWTISDEAKAGVIEKMREFQAKQGGYISRLQGIQLFADAMPGIPSKSAANHLDRLRRAIDPATGAPYTLFDRSKGDS